MLAEFDQAWVSSSTAGDPSFYGCYLTGSWVLTGESHPYDRTVGYARRVIPKSRWGAPELEVRLAHIDLEDAEAHGGEFDTRAELVGHAPLEVRRYLGTHLAGP